MTDKHFHAIRIEEAGRPVVVVETVCPLCHKHNEVRVLQAEWDRWQQGVLIQRAFPLLRSDQREMLMTGTCGACFDKMMAWTERNQ